MALCKHPGPQKEPPKRSRMVNDRSFKARLPGEAFNSDLFEGALANVRHLGPLHHS